MLFITPLNGIVLERQKIKTPFGVFISIVFKTQIILNISACSIIAVLPRIIFVYEFFF